jgi:hypothetical protein
LDNEGTMGSKKDKAKNQPKTRFMTKDILIMLRSVTKFILTRFVKFKTASI